MSYSYAVTCDPWHDTAGQKDALESDFIASLARLQPQTQYMRLFNETVIEVWRDRHEASRALRTKLQGDLAEFRRQLDALDAAFLFRHVVDQETCEQQRDLLREQVATGEVGPEEATVEELDIVGMRASAQDVLTNAAKLWEQGTPSNRQRLQQAFFPEGVELTAKT